MPTAQISIRTENRITPLGPAWALPTLKRPLMSTVTRSPAPISRAISEAILSDQGRSPGASGASVARTAALRSSERLGWAGPGVPSGRGRVPAPELRRRLRLRLRCANAHLGRGGERLTQAARAERGVARLRERADDGDPARSGAAYGGHVGRRDASDGEERHRGVRGRVADELESDRRPAGLRRGGVHRPDSDVVDAEGSSGIDLLGGAGGEADDPAWADDRAGFVDRDVLLAAVHPVGAGRANQVGPVVEHEQRAMRRRGAGEPLPGGDDLRV